MISCFIIVVCLTENEEKERDRSPSRSPCLDCDTGVALMRL